MVAGREHFAVARLRRDRRLMQVIPSGGPVRTAPNTVGHRVYVRIGEPQAQPFEERASRSSIAGQ